MSYKLKLFKALTNLPKPESDEQRIHEIRTVALSLSAMVAAFAKNSVGVPKHTINEGYNEIIKVLENEFGVDLSD